MEEAFFDMPIYREFAQVYAFDHLPDESTVLSFCHGVEKKSYANSGRRQ